VSSRPTRKKFVGGYPNKIPVAGRELLQGSIPKGNLCGQKPRTPRVRFSMAQSASNFVGQGLLKRKKVWLEFPSLLLCFLALSSTALSQSTTPAPTSCAAGSYRAANTSACKSCPYGKFSPSFGATSSATCLSCPYLYFSREGSTNFTDCVDTTCRSNVSQSSKCLRDADCGASESRGTCQNKTCRCVHPFVGTSCSECQDGLTGKSCQCNCGGLGRCRVENGSAACECVAGAYLARSGTPANSTCLVCPAGKYKSSPGSAVCADCGSGTYSTRVRSSSSGTCLTCPINSNSFAGSSSLGSCTCNEGYSGQDADTCTACVSGKYKASTGSILNGNCTDCAAGKYGNATGQSTETSCTSCIAGKYLVGTGGSSEALCTFCTPNSDSPSQSSAQAACTCNAGYGGDASTGACTSCVPGKYKTPAANGDCAGCVAGKYGTATGQTAEASCTDCPSNSYSEENGASTSLTCKSCPVYSNSPASSAALTECTCNVGYSGNANTAGGSCAVCAKGKYKSAARNGDCTDCGAGKYGVSTGQTAEASCTACPTNSNSSAGSSALTSCTCNTISSGSDGGLCTPTSSTTPTTICTVYINSSCSAGDRVTRGPDWVWGNQDNGNSIGTVTRVDTTNTGWCSVTWDFWMDSGPISWNSINYRVGSGGKYDLCYASATSRSTTSSTAPQVVCEFLDGVNVILVCDYMPLIELTVQLSQSPPFFLPSSVSYFDVSQQTSMATTTLSTSKTTTSTPLPVPDTNPSTTPSTVICVCLCIYTNTLPAR
jgi:hypothetical protein